MSPAAEIITADDPDAMPRARAVLAAGGIVAYPTETYFGLGVRADDSAAVARLAGLKGRSAQLPVIAASVATARDWAVISAALLPLTDIFWPGSLTLVVPPRNAVAAPLLSEHGTLAVRVCPHPVATRLAEAAGGVITSTSANLRGEAPAATAAELAPAIRSAVDLVIDDGATPGGAPSTLVGERDGRIVLHREGAVSAAVIGEHLGYVPERA